MILGMPTRLRDTTTQRLERIAAAGLRYLLAALIVGGPALTRGGVDVRGSSSCFDERALTERLEAVVGNVASNRGSTLDVVVTSRPRPHGSRIELTVATSSGAELLSRAYDLVGADCDSAVTLLGVILERFFADLPVQRWPVEARSSSVERPGLPETMLSEPLRLDLSGKTGLCLNTTPQGESGSLSLAAGVGTPRHGLLITLNGRSTLPMKLGPGRVSALLVTGGAGWRYSPGLWQSTVEARGGAILLKGRGFDTDYDRWLPWAELAGNLGICLGPVAVGVELSASPMTHRVITAQHSHVRKVPQLTLGLVLAYVFWGTKI